jgi:hypothetical protein
MTHADYLKYLLRLVGEEGETGSEESFFGLFQRFRPLGSGVEEVFAPLDQRHAYLERILPVYAATASSPLDDAYFIVRRAPVDEETGLRLGKAVLQDLTLLSRHIGDSELLAVCEDAEVELGTIDSADLESDEHLCVYETVGDWFIDQTVFEQPEVLLNEAFYSMASDPWLSLYLGWPHFAGRVPGDPFASYFSLWQAGLDFAYVGQQLRVGPRDAQ